MGKTVVITGSNGFIGSHTAKHLLNAGYQVIGVDIGSTSNVLGVEYKQLNLLSDDIDELLDEYSPYALIHCAGMADVNYSMQHPDSDFFMNVMMTRKILYAVKEKKTSMRMLYMSSAGVYGNPQKLPIEENAERRSISPYALHKTIVEDICEYFNRQYSLDIRVLRIFSAYGNGLKKQIFWDMGQKIKNTGKLSLFGSGNETRDFIHIDDLTSVISLILEAEQEKNAVYNVANGKEVSIRQVAELFCDTLGKPREIISFSNENREGNPSNWCADISKVKKLGYVSQVTLSEGIRKYAEWLKDNSFI